MFDCDADPEKREYADQLLKEYDERRPREGTIHMTTMKA
jgi:hypothetical protein